MSAPLLSVRNLRVDYITDRGPVRALDDVSLELGRGEILGIAGESGSGKTVLVAAHGNSLRALVKHLDGISDTDIAALNIPTGIPLVYRLDENLRPLKAGGEYLDPEAAALAAAAVAAQGKK